MAERDGIGGNNPPLSEVLKDQYAALLADAEKWTSAAARAPATVDDDAALGKFGTLVTNLNKIAREAEAKRKTEKQPHLDAGRTVDGFFGGIMGKINDVVAALEARQKVYIKAKERKARDEAERQQAAAAETAAAALRAAERAQDKGKFDEADALLGEAAAAETAAVAAGEKAEAKTADLVRTHADSGAVVSAKKIWVCELSNRGEFVSATPSRWGTLEPYISDEVLLKAARAAVRAGVRSIPGFKIYEDEDVINRG